MITKKYLIIILLISTFYLNAQIGLGINNTETSSIIDLNSNNKGFLIPRLNLGEQRLIKLPANGLLVFNTTKKCVQVNRGTPLVPIWESVTGGIGDTGLGIGTGVDGDYLDPVTGLPLDVLNIASGSSSAIGGGVDNQATGDYSVIGGGTTNFATGDYSVISGGSTNDASGYLSSIGGGTTNNASGIGASISGGTTNNASGENSSIAGGTSNETSGENSHVGGGSSNFAISLNSSIGGGVSNLASGESTSISGGTSNIASALNSTISGGTSNQAIGVGSSISGGTSNIALGDYSTVGGGTSNIADGISTSIGGGTDNRAYNFAATISGGTSNRANEANSSISGGTSSFSNAINSTVSGGFANFANSYGEWVGGLNSPAYVAVSNIEFSELDRIFNVGCGASFEVFTLLKNGLATLPNATNVDIKSDPKAITTKDFTDLTYSRFSTEAPTSSTAPGILGEIRITPEYMYTCISVNSWVRTPMLSW
jgi:hypothetical protein